MKVLTLNFISCAVKACKSARESFPLHLKDAVLKQNYTDLNPLFLRNILPRLDWDALVVTSAEVCPCFFFCSSRRSSPLCVVGPSNERCFISFLVIARFPRCTCRAAIYGDAGS